METKHTPGPWKARADGAGWYIECAPERGHSVAYIRAESEEEDPDTTDSEKEANAHLIAAAPELLAALQQIHLAMTMRPSGYSSGGGLSDRERMALDTVRMVIAKATTPNA